MGRHGIMVLAMDCGAGGPHFESRSPLFFRERPLMRGRRNREEEESTPVNDHLTRQRACNQGIESIAFMGHKKYVLKITARYCTKLWHLSKIMSVAKTAHISATN